MTEREPLETSVRKRSNHLWAVYSGTRSTGLMVKAPWRWLALHKARTLVAGLNTRAADDARELVDRWDWPDDRFTPEVLRRIGALEDDADEGRMSG